MDRAVLALLGRRAALLVDLGRDSRGHRRYSRIGLPVILGLRVIDLVVGPPEGAGQIAYASVIIASVPAA